MRQVRRATSPHPASKNRVLGFLAVYRRVRTLRPPTRRSTAESSRVDGVQEQLLIQ